MVNGLDATFIIEAEVAEHPGPGLARRLLDEILRNQETLAIARQRLLDTQLAATYFSRGITSIITTNVRDYSVFGCFSLRCPG